MSKMSKKEGELMAISPSKNGTGSSSTAIFTKEFWASVLEDFIIATGTIFLLQLTKIQSAINAGDWNTAKKAALAAIFGIVFAFVKAFYTATIERRKAKAEN
jgi:hypothetical protein